MVKQGVAPFHDADIYPVGIIGSEPFGKIDTNKISGNGLGNSGFLLNNPAHIGNYDIETLWGTEKEKS